MVAHRAARLGVATLDCPTSSAYSSARSAVPARAHRGERRPGLGENRYVSSGRAARNGADLDKLKQSASSAQGPGKVVPSKRRRPGGKRGERLRRWFGARA